MNRFDRAVIGALALVLALVGGAMIRPGSSGSASTPSPSAGAAAPYREGVVGHPSSVNPLTPRTQADQDLVALLFRGLVRTGSDGSMKPDLAIGWSISDDGRTYTFQISPDAYWEDGNPVTADDVAFTIQLLQDPKYDGPYGSSWQGIHVTAAGASTVKFTTVLPIAGFLRQAAIPILPRHLLTDVSAAMLADSAYSSKPTGDGRYRLATLDYNHAVLERVPSVVPTESPIPLATPSAASSASAVASAAKKPTPTPPLPNLSPGPSGSSPSPDLSTSPSPSPTPSATPMPVYSGPTSTVQTIELVFFADAESAASAFAAGKLDAVGGLTPDQTNAALVASGSRLISYRWSTLLSVVLNQRSTHPELQDVSARSGLLAAIDRNTVLSKVLANRGTVAELPIPSWSSAYDSSVVDLTPYDAAAAATYLTTAGWQQNQPGWTAPKASAAYTLDLLTPDQASNPIVYRTAALIADYWRAIGLDVTLDSVPAATYLSRLDNGQFAAAVVDFEVGLEPDLGPLFLSSQIGSGGSNVSGLKDATLDQLLLAARKAIDPDDRKTALAAVEKYVSTIEPILPLAFRDYDLVVSKRVQNVSATQIADPSSRYWDVIDWRLANDR